MLRAARLLSQPLPIPTQQPLYAALANTVPLGQRPLGRTGPRAVDNSFIIYEARE